VSIGVQTVRTAENRERVLAHFREYGNVRKAARDCGIGHDTLYAWRKDDQAFAAEWDDCIALGRENTADKLEEILDARAEAGLSDTAAIFRLKALRPRMYRENISQEHSGPNGGPIALLASAVKSLDIANLSESELELLSKSLIAQLKADAAPQLPEGKADNG